MPTKKRQNQELPQHEHHESKRFRRELAVEERPRENSERTTGFCLPVVCNVKVCHLRPRYDNLFEWMKDPKNEYIARGGVVFINGTRFPGRSSIWANPFKIGRDGNRSTVIKKCEEHYRNLLQEKPELIKELMKLQGKNLGCWCVESPTSDCDENVVCHGQVLIKLMKEYHHRNGLN